MASIMNYAEYIHFSFVIYCQLLASYRRFDFDPKWLEGFIRYLIFQRMFNIQANTFHFTIVKRFAFFQKGQPMILVKNSKRLFPAYFSVLEISFLSSDNAVFPKGGFFDDINVILL